MKYALIGCGRIAVNHVKAALNNDLELTAVCDIEPPKIDGLLEKCKVENAAAIKRYTDYRKMIEENDLELAAIATESGSHAKIAIDCIRHGIHCIIEKPIAMNLADADEIIRLAKETGVQV